MPNPSRIHSVQTRLGDKNKVSTKIKVIPKIESSQAEAQI